MRGGGEVHGEQVLQLEGRTRWKGVRAPRGGGDICALMPGEAVATRTSAVVHGAVEK